MNEQLHFENDDAKNAGRSFSRSRYANVRFCAVILTCGRNLILLKEDGVFERIC